MKKWSWIFVGVMLVPITALVMAQQNQRAGYTSSPNRAFQPSNTGLQQDGHHADWLAFVFHDTMNKQQRHAQKGATDERAD